MSDAAPHTWEWMVTHGRYLGFTLTFTRDISAHELLQRYGATPSAARSLPFVGIDNALPTGRNGAILRVGLLEEWAFGLEILGSQGAAPATVAQISHGTETLVVEMGYGGMYGLSYWVDGRPQESFEPGEAATLRAVGPHPFWDATERHFTARSDGWALLAAMQAVEDHIGAHLTPELDEGPLLSVVVPQILPPPPSPVPRLPLVNSPSRPAVPLGRYLGSLIPPVGRNEP